MPAPCPPFKRLLSGYTENDKTGCWEWTGHKYRNGYGVLKVFGRDVSAHRYSYELHNGPIKAGFSILHSCDNKSCINPEHLRQGTHAENMAEAKERGLMKSKQKGRPSPAKGIRNVSAKPVYVLGRVYGSMNEAERELCLGSGTVRFWTLNNPQKAKLISREEYQNAQ
ncbi:HNH endonuclease signature motif containing protein [Shinella sp. BE166]|uniref:HNH endonuclease signature motif containing protein n=1 Tax=Shinella sp. BE166 TaxID=3373918 RepID=UPI003EBAD92B